MSRNKRTGKRKAERIIPYTFGFEPGSGFIYRLHPSVKIILFVIFTFTVLFQRSLVVLGLITLGVIIFGKSAAGMGIGTILRRLRWIILFTVGTVFINVLFSAVPSGRDTVVFYILYPRIPIRRYALYVSFRMAFWVLSLSSSAVIFISTTSPGDIVAGMHTLGFNYRLTYPLTVGLRYIPLIGEQSDFIKYAQLSRGIDVSTVRGFRNKLAVLKNRLVSLLVSVFRNTDTTARSMELRGFGRYRKRTEVFPISLKIRDVAVGIITSSVLVLIALYGYGMLPFLPLPPSLYSILEKIADLPIILFG